jgi:hypothetical protein
VGRRGGISQQARPRVSAGCVSQFHDRERLDEECIARLRAGAVEAR